MATAVDLPRIGSSDRSRLIAVLGLAVVVELMLGALIGADHGKLALAAIAAVAATVVVVRFPFAAACLVLVLAASVFTVDLPRIPFGGSGFYLFEPLLGLLLCLAAVRPRRSTWGGAIGLALALFLGVLVLSSLVAIQSGNATFNEIVLSGRGYAMLTFFWIVIRLFPEREQVLRLIGVAIVIGAVTGLVAFALAAGVKPSALLLDPNRAAFRPEESGFARVRLPGLALAFLLLWTTILFISRRVRPRWLWWLCLGGILVNILVSLNRNMWVAGGIGLVLVLVLLGPLVRGRIVATLGVVGAAICLFALVPATQPLTESALSPIADRAGTLLDPGKVTEETSLQDRDRENRIAWDVAQDNLLIGIAPGTVWGMYTTEGSGVDVRFVPQQWVHNQYLYLLMITGVPGVLLLVLFLGGSAASALTDPRGRPELIMLGIALLTLMLTAIVMLSLSDYDYLLASALVAGCIYALKHEEQPA